MGIGRTYMNKIFVDQIKKKGDINKPGPGTYYQNFFNPQVENATNKEGGEDDDAKSDVNDVR